MLNYLFTAIYEDGTTYDQNPEDVSLLDPKRSCFYDVLEACKESRLVRFELRSQDLPRRVYAVDLVDGHFEVNGTMFRMRETGRRDVHPMEVAKPVALEGFRLVYFRPIERDFQAGVEYGTMSNPQAGAVRVSYCLGWQCTVGGKNFQELIQFA